MGGFTIFSIISYTMWDSLCLPVKDWKRINLLYWSRSSILTADLFSLWQSSITLSYSGMRSGVKIGLRLSWRFFVLFGTVLLACYFVAALICFNDAWTVFCFPAKAFLKAGIQNMKQTKTNCFQKLDFFVVLKNPLLL